MIPHINYASGWSKKGAKLTKIKTQVRQRYTVISIISNKKVVNTKIMKGTCDGQKFKTFMEETLKIIGGVNYSVLLDNARIHHSRLLHELKTKINFIYNIPYSPEYNPIEHVFSKVKHLIKNKSNTNRNIIKHITTSFKQISKLDLTNYYSTCINKLNK